jgi:hypothetical protein
MRRVFLPVDVQCRNDVPTRVQWNGRDYRVESLVECWVVETRWWTDTERRRVYYRLYTQQGILDVFRSDTQWVLARIAD